MKKIILIACVAIIAIGALFVNVSLNNNGQTGNIDLAQLRVTNDANAECTQWMINNGKCLVLVQLCVGDPFPEDQNCYTFY